MHKITVAGILIAYGGIHLMRGHKPSLLHCFKDLIQVEWWWWCYASSLSPVSAYESWLSLCCIHAASALCISPPLPPPLRLDVTNSWICTFLYQNQHAPHHRLVQIWSEHTQNPPAAWWWIGILGTMLMHQSSTRRQMTVNCFSDKSVVWDSTDWGWIEALPRWSRRGGVPGNLVREIRWWPHLILLGYADYLSVASVIFSLFGKCKGEIEQSAALQRRKVSGWNMIEISPITPQYVVQLWGKYQLLSGTSTRFTVQ